MSHFSVEDETKSIRHVYKDLSRKIWILKAKENDINEYLHAVRKIVYHLETTQGGKWTLSIKWEKEGKTWLVMTAVSNASTSYSYLHSFSNKSNMNYHWNIIEESSTEVRILTKWKYF